MGNKNKVKKNKRGAILIYILMTASISVTILSGLAIFVASNQRNSSNEVSRQKALQIAENGVYYYKWYLAHSLDGKNQQQIKDFWENGDPLGVGANYNRVVENFDGEEVGEFEISVEAPESNSTIVLVEATGWTYRHPNIKRKIQVRFRKPSWSEYSVLANEDIRFGEGTNVFGPVHCNGGIRFDGQANNIVTSAVEEYEDPDTGIIRPGVWTSQPDESQVFLAGKDFPVTLVDFNSVTSDLNLIESEAENEGIHLDDDYYVVEDCRYRWFWKQGWVWTCYDRDIEIYGYRLTLRTDDKVEIRRVSDYGGRDSWETETYSIFEESDPEILDIPSNGLIFADKHIWVEGQINGVQLSIVSADLDGSSDPDIYINNDILYTNYDGSDTIGLIAENNILVGYYSENDLEIDGALLAQKGKVGRNYYHNNYKDEITVRGSIATNKRYGFAYTDGTGYDVRNLYFDNNLVYFPPPYFPTGTVYQLDLWEDIK